MSPPAQSGSGKPEAPRPSRLLKTIGIVAVVLALYVLSSGPVGLYFTKREISGPVSRGLYQPLVKLYLHTPLRRPLEAYWQRWGDSMTYYSWDYDYRPTTSPPR